MFAAVKQIPAHGRNIGDIGRLILKLVIRQRFILCLGEASSGDRLIQLIELAVTTFYTPRRS